MRPFTRISIPRTRRTLSNPRGVIDLASILVGVLVTGIMATGIVATVFAVVPWTQDQAAKQDLAAVRTAQSVAQVKEGTYLTAAQLSANGYLSVPGTAPTEQAFAPRGAGAGALAMSSPMTIEPDSDVRVNALV